MNDNDLRQIEDSSRVFIDPTINYIVWQVNTSNKTMHHVIERIPKFGRIKKELDGIILRKRLEGRVRVYA